jgi:multicomponent Na+:H+ antiporter subunit F
MSPWLIAACILLVALLPCGAVCLLGSPLDALAALEVAGSIATAILVLLAAGTHRQSFIDLALIFVLLNFAGALTFARLLERRL